VSHDYRRKTRAQVTLSQLDGDHVLDRICARARERPSEVALQFAGADAEPTILTWGELFRMANQAAGGLAAQGLRRGDRLLLSMPTGPHYVATLLGAFLAGVVPASLHPVDRTNDSAASSVEFGQLLSAVSPRLVVSPLPLPWSAVPVITPERLLNSSRATAEFRNWARASETAYIQFTSGSTGRPRGLALTWPAILANVRTMAAATPVTERDHMVSWLPMYHDMGLFGATLTILYVGAGLTLIDTGVFMNNPLLWFRVIHAVRATMTVTPPSALQVCNRLLSRRSVDWDLSSLNHIICGAEPVSHRFVRTIANGLGRLGVRSATLRPVYGLAEATLAVTFPPGGREPGVDFVDRPAFETKAVAMPAAETAMDVQAWVSVGNPLPGIDLKIVDANDAELPERSAGRLLVRSPSLFSGVYEAGRFSARQGEWLDTGDLGYLAMGELYITGRRKDIIISHGRNLSPDRLEELACLVNGVRRAAAFGVFEDDKMTERVIVLAEVRGRELASAEARDALRMQLRAALASAGYLIDAVLPVGKGQLPLTTSGKIRRQQCRELFVNGSFGESS
jgi:acyl-CoA synthetase (AMP-forming)/AMP-acid ligase II